MTVCSFTIRLGKGQTSCPQHLKQCRPILLDCIIFLYMCSKILLASNVNMAKEGKKKRKKKKPRRFLIIITFRLISERPIFDLMSHCVKPLCDGGKLTFYMLWTFSCVIWGGFLCCTRVKWWIRKHHICFVCNELNIFAVKHIWSFGTALSVPLSRVTGYSFILTLPFSLWWADHWWRMMMLRWWRYRWDAVKWGSPPTCRPRKQEIHASLPATHTALWFYRWVCVITCLLLNVGVGMWGVTICHSGVMSHMRVCVFGRDCEGHLCCYWQSSFSSHMKMILVSSSSPSSSVVGRVLPEVHKNIH